MPRGESQAFSDPEIDDFIEFLETTLIPDLLDSGYDATAEDFQEAIRIIDYLRVKGDRLSLDTRNPQ
jgi:hypothetical protein